MWNSNIKVNITIPSLASLRVNGSGNINAKNFMNGDFLAATINGSGDIFVNDSKYNKVNYSIHGSGEIELHQRSLLRRRQTFPVPAPLNCR
ncbi:MAG: DUF2807 domain-containing protein [Ferruginibacter sp.]